jgi:hypothetical protein
VAEPLATRHHSLRIVGAAVILARQAVQQCHALVDEAAVEDSEEGWAEWMAAGRKMEALAQAQHKIALASGALQLALSAVAASGLPAGHAAAPFRYVPAAFEQAHTTLTQMEMGRTRSVLLCGGELWQRGAGARGSMRHLFRCRVRLHRGHRKPGAEEDGSSEEEEEEEEEEGEEAGGAGGAGAADTPPSEKGSEKESSALCLWFVRSGGADAGGGGGGGGGEGGGGDGGCEMIEDRVLLLDETVG